MSALIIAAAPYQQRATYCADRAKRGRPSFRDSKYFLRFRYCNGITRYRIDASKKRRRLIRRPVKVGFVMVLCARATFGDAREKGRASAIGSTRPHRPFGRHRAARPHRSLLNFGSKSTPCALLLVKTIRIRLGTYRSVRPTPTTLRLRRASSRMTIRSRRILHGR